jgi:broad specificity phosphatase PhoE
MGKVSKSMRRLILIKHARPQVDPKVPSELWTLGDEGRAGATRLAERLRGYSFAQLVTSREPKAVETARVIGEVLGRPVVEANDLFEHDRSTVPHMDSREFISMVALFFKQPDELVLGEETADEAYERFASAVDDVVAAADPAAGDVAIVTHGTVLALFAERRAKQEPFGLWRRMGLPSFMVLEMPSWRVAEVVERV